MGDMMDMGGGGGDAGASVGGDGGGDSGGIGSIMGGGDSASSAPAPTTDYSTGSGSGSGGALSGIVSDSMSSAAASSSTTSSTSIKSPDINVAGSGTTPINAKADSTGDASKSSSMGGDIQKASTDDKSNKYDMKSMANRFATDMNKPDQTSSVQSAPPIVSTGNTYGALFGTPNTSTNINRPAPPAAPMSQLQSQPLAQPAQMPAPPPQVPMSAPPPPMQLGVSDVRAKTNIRDADGTIDAFLQKVYNNVISKGKR